MKREVAVVACMLAAFAACFLGASAAPVQSAILEVYADGVARFKATLAVSGTEVSVTLPLLADGERVYNVLATDEAGSALAYDVEGRNATIYSLGATRVTVEYDTDALAFESDGLWTLAFTSPFEVAVVLPENSVVIYINAAPLSMSAEGGRLRLRLPPGSWEVCYEVQAGPNPPAGGFPPEWLAASAAVAAAMTCAALCLKRRKSLAGLRREEADVLRFIRERGGRVLEAELRGAFPNIPRTSMWRLVRRLERMGRVRVRKVGLQNVVELA